jgi:hypothetical protein
MKLMIIILPVLASCSAISSMTSMTTARRCYNALMTLGYSKINQYETCPVSGSDDEPGKSPHYDDDYNQRSQIGFGVGENKKSALDAAEYDARGSIPILPNNHRQICDDNIAQWECTVIVEWFNPPEYLDYMITNKRSPINYIRCEANGDYSMCIQGDHTNTYINR